MKFITLRLLVVTAIMLLGSVTSKAQIFNFTYSPAHGYPVPLNDDPYTSPISDACQATVTISYTRTSLSTGVITAYSTSHTFNINETYSFQIYSVIGSVNGNVNFTFTIPCQGAAYGPISKATATGAYQPVTALSTTNSGVCELVMTYTPAGGLSLPSYSFSFQPNLGIGG